MGYRNSVLYNLKYVAEMLEEDEGFLRDCSIGMFSEYGCLSAYDDYPASELTSAQGEPAATPFDEPDRYMTARKNRPRRGDRRCLGS